MTGLRSLKADYDKALLLEHPSLANKNLKVQDLFGSKSKRAKEEEQKAKI